MGNSRLTLDLLVTPNIECWYDNSLSSTATGNGYTTPCGGYAGEYCGGGWLLTMCENTAWQAPTVNAGVDDWVSLGCYPDSSDSRTLSNVVTDNAMTVAECASLAGSGAVHGLGIRNVSPDVVIWLHEIRPH